MSCYFADMTYSETNSFFWHGFVWCLLRIVVYANGFVHCRDRLD